MIIAAFDHFIYNDVAEPRDFDTLLLDFSTSDFRLDGITEFCVTLVRVRRVESELVVTP